MDRALIVAVAVVVVGLGCGVAVLRPGLAPVGTTALPSLGSGGRVRVWPDGRRAQDVSRFAGRGPAGAK